MIAYSTKSFAWNCLASRAARRTAVVLVEEQSVAIRMDRYRRPKGPGSDLSGFLGNRIVAFAIMTDLFS
jgi:hypothetical protein